MSQPAINKRLARLAQMSSLHICEPVIASTIVQPRGGLRAHIFASVIDAILPYELVKNAVDGSIDVARERRHAAGKVKLFPTMYMVLGSTTFGLYALPPFGASALIGAPVLHLPRIAILGLDLEQRHGAFQFVTLRVAASTPLPLRVQRMHTASAQHMHRLIERGTRPHPW